MRLPSPPPLPCFRSPLASYLSTLSPQLSSSLSNHPPHSADDHQPSLSALSSPSLSSLAHAFIDRPDVSAWNALIADLARNGDSLEALHAYTAMRRTKVRPDRSTLPCAIKAAANLANLTMGLVLHHHALVSGLICDAFVSSSLINMYSNCSKPDEAEKAFIESPFKNQVHYTVMLSCYAQNNLPMHALGTWRDMRRSGVSPDPAALVTALSSCGPDTLVARMLHGVAERAGLSRNTSVANTLMGAYLKAKGASVVLARQVFDEMSLRDIVSYNTMISGYGQAGLAVEALALVHRIHSELSEPASAVTLSAVLLACAQAGALRFGLCVHTQALHRDFHVNVFVGTALIDMYCKCGRVDLARKAFDMMGMEYRNVKTWTAMVAGYGMHGRSNEALQVFREMRENAVEPNYITFVGVLSACSHVGFIEEGWRWFNAMKMQYGIEPGVEHYGCMVDLLGRAGLLDQAYALIKSMAMKPDFVVWGALLGACKIHKNVKLGEISAKKLFELDPKNTGYYVLLSNIYSEAGRWEDAEKIRVLMKKRGLVKAPGYSLVEHHGRVHFFLVGDREHPQSEEIYGFLERLMGKLQEAGYVADTKEALHDVDEEEKETSLWVHSEKLAVAFGVLNMGPRVLIRVIKNLRVCVDCHNVIKMIAKLEGREIVVRDSNRFHHFCRDGTCSCGDYW
ncbi:pentatricopeptide repeat-containing protein At3g26782, mitochondrial [Amborella trichopoda]|uniref:pentatricopeptide repeat-containing protein At3g26782, mitochondrial n=1 Tax=Amborella trichopoda TaxID=13333 RepID=UPI0005D308E3|nr:pentatricopeptide repeat-containing protein At3g26782, mitochondrial [Amborella trichopoda]|eukprot:XP_011623535.1 pentatricopeptide repeat-containing protein At3g26782, mitochondrial [Amborella trichopoda]